jgi:hypothetical protein
LSGISLILDLIKALEDGAGSGQEYRDLIKELCSLERSLLAVNELKVDESLQFHKNAIEQVAGCCQETISTFLTKITDYSPYLRLFGSGNTIKDTLKKVQWALCTKDGIKKFRAQIAGHCLSLQTLLATLQL